MDVAGNECKTKSLNNFVLGPYRTVGSHDYEVVDYFVYT